MRPFALKDQRTASAYIFGAICPALGKATGLILPICNTEAMELQLKEIALAVQPGAHAGLFVDQAGWHVTAKLTAPENMTLVPLPSKSPEFNPVKNIWQYMHDNWLSNRIVKIYDDNFDLFLLQLEQTPLPPLAHHVTRNARLGPWVRLLETWY